MHAAISTLPMAIHWLVPELTALEWPEESRATCSDCVMAKQEFFRDEVRCCTYQPQLANFLVGRVLRDGGQGADLMRAEMNRGAQCNHYGVSPLNRPAYQARGQRAFGQDLSLKCPYFVGGELACGIWAHRNSVCRTWHCLYVHGGHGWYAWEGVRGAIDQAEAVLAEHCVKTGDVPPKEAGIARWLAWYQWCARTVDRIEPSTLEGLQNEALANARSKMRSWHKVLDAEMPHVLSPQVRGIERDEETVTLSGYTRFDPMVLPAAIFELLARLDGTRNWWTALAEAEDATGRSLGGEDTIRTMWRLGILAPPRPDEEVAPGEMAMIFHDDGGKSWRTVEPAEEVGALFRASEPGE